ncbi:MAG: hypothetical protein ACQEXV_06855 [Bacillota bacterium]|uniref:hypothetical protein n=1 Tax=Paenibacillus maysiensis TaxID=1155954 RepID=UPI00139237D2|nr:hypothetical protein [Paenibacillus maysiensis]
MHNYNKMSLKAACCATTQSDGASHRHRHRRRISGIKPMIKVEIRGQKRPLRLYSTIPPTPF